MAQEYNHQTIEPAHLLLALVQQPKGSCRHIITSVAGSTAALRQELVKDLENRPRVYGSARETPGLSRPTSDVLAAAERYAKGMQDEYVSTEHILLGLTDSSESKRLGQFGLTKDAILAGLDSRCAVPSASPRRTPKGPTNRWKNMAAT